MMASFELDCCYSDGHIKALYKAIQMASKISNDALLDFDKKRLRITARSQEFLVKFEFDEKFFQSYQSDTRHKCYVNLKSLLCPFKAQVLFADRDFQDNTRIMMRCSVEDEVNSRLVFKVGSSTDSKADTTLTYKIPINDLEQERIDQLSAINRHILNPKIILVPKQTSSKFLLAPINIFAPIIDQLSIVTSEEGIRFIGSSSAFNMIDNKSVYTEFQYKKGEFSEYTVNDKKTTITLRLRNLKSYLNLVEMNNKVQSNSKYTFEGEGLPAHFVYNSDLFSSHFMAATAYSYVPAIEDGDAALLLPIDNGPYASLREVQTQENDDQESGPNYNNQDIDDLLNNSENDDIDDEDDGYNDNQSEESDFLDGNLEGLNTTGRSGLNTTGATGLNNSLFDTSIDHNNSIFGAESIRSEMTTRNHQTHPIRVIIDLDEDYDELNNMQIVYSSSEPSDSDSDDDVDVEMT